MSTDRMLNHETVFVCAATSAAAFACDGTGSASSIARQTAGAFALAIAGSAGGCVLAGDASAKVYASAQARSKAEVWLSAYFEAIALAATCGKCEAFTTSWGYIEKWVFLEAIAKAEFKVCLPSADQVFQHFNHRICHRVCVCRRQANLVVMITNRKTIPHNDVNVCTVCSVLSLVPLYAMPSRCTFLVAECCVHAILTISLSEVIFHHL
jgi:hypothetical protein